MLKEFKPALLFLVKFLGFYFVCNVLYGIIIESYDNKADPITEWVAVHCARVLDLLGFNTYHEFNPTRPTVFLKENNDVIVSIFEGCNGINVMIVFVAFIFAFGGPNKKMLWFIPSGLALIHVFNLARISLLYYTAIHSPANFYYLHKYFFTAILYLVIFVLWAIWVVRFNLSNKHKVVE